MIKNSTLFYVVDEFYNDINLLLEDDFFNIENPELVKRIKSIEYAPPDDLVRRILIENL